MSKDIQKQQKNKKYPLRNFFLELKRVRWPSRSEAAKAYYKMLAFVIVFVIIFFVITLAVTYLWNYLGVGLSVNSN